MTKTIRAGTMAAALALVKRELGSDAVILRTRTYRRGGLFGLGARTVVELTATTEERLVQRRRPAPQRPTPRTPREVEDPAAGPTTGDLIRRTYLAACRERAAAGVTTEPEPASASASQALLTQVAQAAAATAVAPPKPARSVVSEDILAADASQLCREMAAVRRMVERVMHAQSRQPGAAPTQMPDALFDQYLALLKQDVAEELAQQIIDAVKQRLSAEQLRDPEQVRGVVREAISCYFPVDPSLGRLMPTPDGRPRVVALVGPTGVGKTTTIAKLAATFKLKQARHVGLITMDTYRIAAVDQLRTYADIIGVPLHVVSSPAELEAALSKCRGCETVLIDTAGRSQRDDPKLEQLRQLLAVARPHEVHLVLASTANQSVMMDAVERFSVVGVDHILFTKLDEAVTFGVLLNIAQRVGKQLSYVTTGQEVPHQIHAPEASRLADLVLGGVLP